MRRSIVHTVTALAMALTIVSGSAMPICAAESEITTEGTHDLTVTATVTADQAYWYKVKIPTEVSLNFDQFLTNTIKATDGDGYVGFSGAVFWNIKGFIPASKKVTVSVPASMTLTGQTNASKTFLATPEIRTTGSGGWEHGISVDFYSGSADPSAGKRMGEEYMDMSTSPMLIFSAKSENPSPQTYIGTMAFTITYGDA